MQYFIPCTSDHPCGKGSTAYTHKLSGGLVELLIKIMKQHSKTKTPVHMDDLDLDRIQYCNWKSLKYFGLVEDCGDAGVTPTTLAQNFCMGLAPVWTTVAVMDGEIIPDGHEAWLTHKKPRVKKYIYELAQEPWKPKKEYLAEKTTQSSIFSIL